MRKINKSLFGTVLLLIISSPQVLAYTCPTADEVIIASNTAVAEGQTEFTMHEPYGDFVPAQAVKMERNDITFYQAGVLHDQSKTTSLAQVGCSYYPNNTKDPDSKLTLIQKAASADERINFNGNNSSKWWTTGPQDSNIYCSEYHAESCVFEPASDK